MSVVVLQLAGLPAWRRRGPYMARTRVVDGKDAGSYGS
ncbi:MAG: hypothetical protein AVDCRST_MAG78-2123 [uncultured Rubrobacteraceae bacterium]|uniref:Uncharacterized protein n=1 Tax=uncultured Rubrobacteraceae bacterium TaxID=349277 RepID=A0A6J4QGW1_9ACTN|nr:MAG: hypothetical protein AVDCRST_MAG78-2123 [uncultured Rubrobacteraceae bacterium]